MAKFTPLAPDSAPFKILMRLRDMGGRSTQTELIPKMWGDFTNTKRFKKVALVPLMERGLITVSSRLVAMTPEGQLFAEHNSALITARRASPNMASTLNLQKYGRPPERRPGAYDYREMPSLIGEKRVPFVKSDANYGEDAE